MTKGFALPTFLIFGVLIFAAHIIVSKSVEQKYDLVIGEKQRAAIVHIQQTLSVEQLEFNQFVRNNIWSLLRKQSLADPECSYYGRPIIGKCSLAFDLILAYKNQPVKIKTYSFPSGIEVYASSGQFIATEKLLPVTKEKEYNVSAGTFLDFQEVLPFPSFTAIVNELQNEAQACAIGVHPEVCPGKRENEVWAAQAITPWKGLPLAEQYTLHIIEQIKKCTKTTSCKCQIQYPDAKFMGVDTVDFIESIAKEENKIRLSPSPLTIQVRSQTYSVGYLSLHVYTGEDKVVSSLELLPTGSSPFYKWKAVDSSEGAFEPADFIVNNGNDLVFYPKSAFVDLPNCQLPQTKYVFKLISKKLYPPDATPLQFYVATEVSS